MKNKLLCIFTMMCCLILLCTGTIDAKSKEVCGKTCYTCCPQCVNYIKFEILPSDSKWRNISVGEARLWWDHATNEERSISPQVGSIMVFDKWSGSSAGHVAYVTSISGNRVSVKHSNIDCRCTRRSDTFVMSPDNRTAVMVGNEKGTKYPVKGFVLLSAVRPSPTPPQPPPQDTKRLNAIKQLYRDVLGREADKDGLNSYYSSNQSTDAIRQSLLNSAECRQGKGGECKQRYGTKYSIRISNIDDEGTCHVNGKLIKSVGYHSDSNWVPIPADALRSGKNEIKFKVLEKGGGYTYHFGIQKNGKTIWEEKCGDVGKKGCTKKKLKKGDTLAKTYEFKM